MNQFDWVKARSECTVDKVFEQLVNAVQQDLKNFSALHPGPAQCRRFVSCGEERFFIEKTGVHRVVFEKSKSNIQIDLWSAAGKHTHLMRLSVHLDDDGNCALTDEKQRVWSPWQVRRRALEDTFFATAT